MVRSVRVAYFSCCILWGCSWLFIKVGLRDLPPFLFAGTRMLLASAVLLPFAVRGGLRGRGKRAWRWMIVVGLLQIGVPYGLLFTGQQWVPSGLAAVLFATFPVWLLLFGRLLLPGQRLTAKKMAAAVLGIAGVAFLELPALAGEALSPLVAGGGALVLAASMLIAFANVLLRKELSGLPAVVITFVQVLAGALFLMGLAGALESGSPARFTPEAVVAVGYLAVFGTAVTYLCFFWLIPRVPMTAIGAIPLLDTTVAVTLGVLVLHERVGWPLLVGGALVLAGAALANQAPAEPAPQA